MLQLLHDFIAAPSFLPVGNLTPVLIHPDRHQMIMHPVDIVVPVYDIRLIPVTKALHKLFCKSDNLLLRHIVRLCRIDRGMKRHLFAATAPALIDGEGFHRILRVRNLRGEDHLGLTLGDLLLIVLDGRAATRCRRLDLDYHCRTRKSMENSRRIQSFPAGARSIFDTHTSRFT